MNVRDKDEQKNDLVKKLNILCKEIQAGFESPMHMYGLSLLMRQALGIIGYYCLAYLDYEHPVVDEERLNGILGKGVGVDCEKYIRAAFADNAKPIAFTAQYPELAQRWQALFNNVSVCVHWQVTAEDARELKDREKQQIQEQAAHISCVYAAFCELMKLFCSTAKITGIKLGNLSFGRKQIPGTDNGMLEWLCSILNQYPTQTKTAMADSKQPHHAGQEETLQLVQADVLACNRILAEYVGYYALLYHAPQAAAALRSPTLEDYLQRIKRATPAKREMEPQTYDRLTDVSKYLERIQKIANRMIHVPTIQPNMRSDMERMNEASAQLAGIWSAMNVPGTQYGKTRRRLGEWLKACFPRRRSHIPAQAEDAQTQPCSETAQQVQEWKWIATAMSPTKAARLWIAANPANSVAGWIGRRYLLYRKIGMVCLSTAAVVLCIALGLWQWSVHPFVTCYADYIWRNGRPEGILALSKEEAAGRSAHYELTTVAGRVIRVEQIDGHGSLRDETMPERLSRPAVISIDDQNEVYRFYNRKMEPLVNVGYGQGQMLTLLNPYDMNQVLYMPSDILNVNINEWGGMYHAMSNLIGHVYSPDQLLQQYLGAQNEGGLYSGIETVSYRLNDDGQIVELRFGRGDDIRTDENGIAGISLQYDELGRTIQMEYSYIGRQDNGQRIVGRKYRYGDDGSIAWRDDVFADQTVRRYAYLYDPETGDCVNQLFQTGMGMVRYETGAVNGIAYAYEDGRLVQESKIDRLNDVDRPAKVSYGYQKIVYRYDPATGDLRQTIYYDQLKNMCNGPEQWAARITTLDETGAEVTTYYDSDEEPVCNADGYAKKLVYQGDGSLLIALYDAQGKPVEIDGQPYRVQVDMNEEKRVQSVTLVDAAGNAQADCAYPHISFAYKEPSRVLESVTYSSGARGSLRFDFTYNQKGYCERIEAFGREVEDAQLCRWDMAYDVHTGRLLSVQCLNRQGELRLDDTLGFAMQTVDEKDHTVVSRFYNADPVPQLMLNHRVGYAQMEEVYDLAGRRTSVKFYGADERPIVPDAYGYASMACEYREAELQREPEKSGKQFMLGTMPMGVGQLSWREFRDENGRLTSVDGVWGAREEYEDYYENGVHVMRFIRYGDESKQLEFPEGYRCMTIEMTDNNRKIAVSITDADGKLRYDETNGFAKCMFLMDENMMTLSYYDENDQLHVNPHVGYAKQTTIVSKVMARGKEIELNEIKYTDADNRLMMPADEAFAWLAVEYHEELNYVEIRQYNENYQLLRQDFFSPYNPAWVETEHGYSAAEYSYANGLKHIAYLNEEGACFKQENRDANGNLVVDPVYGYAVEKNERTAEGGSKSYFDEHEKLMNSPVIGCAQVKVTINEDGNVVTAYYDAEDHPVYNPVEGVDRYLIFPFTNSGSECAAVRMGFRQYDEADGNQKLVRADLLDSEMQPVYVESLGFATYRRILDGNGDAIEEAYYDTQDQLCFNPAVGFAVSLIDETGEGIYCTYLDENRAPVVNPVVGAAGVLEIYDEQIRLREKAYFGVDHEPVLLANETYHRVVMEYDEESGDAISRKYLDLSGQPVVSAVDGYAIVTEIKTVVDESTKERIVRYAGAEGETLLFNAQKGYAIFKQTTQTLDDQTRTMVTAEFCDESGRLAMNPQLGYAKAIKIYDVQSGVVCDAKYYDENDQLYVVPELGYAWYQREWDRTKTTEYRYNEQEQLMVKKVFKLVSLNMNLVEDDVPFGCPEISYYDGAGKRLEDTDGVAYTKTKSYARDGDQYVQVIWYGADERPVQAGIRVTEIRQPKNENVIVVRHFDANGFPAADESGIASSKTKIVALNHVGDETEPILLEESFDLCGNCISQLYKDKWGKKLSDSMFGYDERRMEYNAFGELQSTRYYDFDGNELMPVGGIDGLELVRYTDHVACRQTYERANGDGLVESRTK